ncbi:hypothetical protein [Serratia sp. JSRIV006]|uniref:hypothetical protein n=1 Tax=Serratia sp. JSRIV006 TaxID=2831896 RepID=UPI001CC1026E|nr:hypothetical protein [Serratia sp. JSRIV006]UAN63399.1 hypothetical protein KGP16_02035 [Serratia sp. JSRIV006]
MSFSKNSPMPMFNLMDGLWDFSKVANVFYCVLFIDVMFAIFTGKGVFYFATESEAKFVLGDILGVILSFGFFSSLLLIFISLFFSYILIEVKYRYMKIDDSSDYLKHGPGYVRLSKLHDEALNNQSGFIYNIYHEENEKLNKKIKDNQRSEYVSVGIFLLFLIEWYLLSSNGSTFIFLDWLKYVLMQYVEGVSHWTVNFYCAVLSLLYAVTVCWPREISNMVYYPPLYKKLEEQKKAQAEQQRAIELEIEQYIKR